MVDQRDTRVRSLKAREAIRVLAFALRFPVAFSLFHPCNQIPCERNIPFYLVKATVFW